MLTLKIRSRSLKSNQFFNYPSDTIHKVWPESIILVEEIECRQAFLSKFDIQNAGVTLKCVKVTKI